MHSAPEVTPPKHKQTKTLDLPRITIVEGHIFPDKKVIQSEWDTKDYYLT